MGFLDGGGQGGDLALSQSAVGGGGFGGGGGACIFGCTALLSGIAVLAAVYDYDLSQESAFFAVTGLGGLCFAKCQYVRLARDKGLIGGGGIGGSGGGWGGPPPPFGGGGGSEGWKRRSDDQMDDDPIRNTMHGTYQKRTGEVLKELEPGT